MATAGRTVAVSASEPPRSPGRLPRGRNIGLVAAGGSLGAVARVGLGELLPVEPGAFAWTTLLTNVLGAFALALVITLLAERRRAGSVIRLTLCIGALGAFTTYSTLALEISAHLLNGQTLLAIGYAAASLLVGVLAAVAGVRGGRHRARRYITTARREDRR